MFSKFSDLFSIISICLNFWFPSPPCPVTRPSSSISPLSSKILFLLECLKSLKLVTLLFEILFLSSIKLNLFLVFSCFSITFDLMVR
ncbi:unnamed protein product [Moneuplotes crassus]|uniref:Uncharacterized protein n=1 Tax=Euplotes crassus TaxID=5936 RepID=A0AAD2D0U8_EUPCR|nr:unnamed protein product [Moneuplotes crassus]